MCKKFSMIIFSEDIQNAIKHSYSIRNSNKRLMIPMKLVLSFFKKKVNRLISESLERRGESVYIGGDNLVIRCNIINGEEYLESIEYRRLIENNKDNTVTPIQILDLLNKKGKKYFVERMITIINQEIEKIDEEIERNSHIVEICEEMLKHNEQRKIENQLPKKSAKSPLPLGGGGMKSSEANGRTKTLWNFQKKNKTLH